MAHKHFIADRKEGEFFQVSHDIVKRYFLEVIQLRFEHEEAVRLAAVLSAPRMQLVETTVTHHKRNLVEEEAIPNKRRLVDTAESQLVAVRQELAAKAEQQELAESQLAALRLELATVRQELAKSQLAAIRLELVTERQQLVDKEAASNCFLLPVITTSK